MEKKRLARLGKQVGHILLIYSVIQRGINKMLELKDIRKDYPAGGGVVRALRGINLQFRKNEFVSILGPSGCGKTTLLNIIGGLDQYTEGDLIINGRSTKDYKDRDWDTYRNHSVGFVFQSYNLIPHQTVLQNVEIALSLSGVSKHERRKRAKEALERVGLGDQLKKKPGEMSGGQMQRVAIARAIVNNPDIILADEPTGALDTETSVQVMDILKEISKDCLVIMVTHNPELAEKYSTRIIRMLDGNTTTDTNPLSVEEVGMEAQRVAHIQATETKQSRKKPSMSIFTSFGLSLKNLISKKGRTILTSFAGSIGIIGIALIYAVSNGATMFIDSVQEETLSSYPLTIEAQHMDMGSLLETFMGQAESAEKHDNDAIYQKAMFYNMVNALNSMETIENDLKAFKAYIENAINDEDDKTGLKEALLGIQYTYNTDLLVYTQNIDGSIIRSDTQELLQELLIEYMGMDMSGMINMQESYGFSMMSPSAVLWQEILTGDKGKLVNDVVEKQYDVIYGSWPNQYDEIVLVVDDNNEIDDMTLYALGLLSKEDIDELADAAFNKTPLEVKSNKWSFEEICDMDFRVVLGSSCYKYNEKTGLYDDLRKTETGLKFLYDNGLKLKVSGIIKPNPDATSTMLTGSIGYTAKLTDYIIKQAENSDAVKAQLANPSIDIFTGKPFAENTGNLSDADKVTEFKKYIDSLNDDGKAAAYVKIMSIPTDHHLEYMMTEALKSVGIEKVDGAYTETGIDIMKKTLTQSFSEQMGMKYDEVAEYINSMPEEDIINLFVGMLEQQIKDSYAQGIEQSLSQIPVAELVAALNDAMQSYTEEQFAQFYDEVVVFSGNEYEANLCELGYVDLDSPYTINLYASSFENKDVIEAAIAQYNKDVDDLQKIAYTDYVGIMMSSVTTIINAITYVLIAFVAVSLVVSSIMIGVITLISVQERTKEIGILRAIGASKQNVSGMFNAETVMIGFTSGFIGVVVTAILCLPINMILQYFTGLGNLRAQLPLPVALILIGISVMLTLVSGIIPSLSAAKKEPVVALRTE